MLDLEKLLRVRSAYAGRFGGGSQRLYFVSDLNSVPQVWSTSSAGGADEQPALELSPPDRAQTLHPGPRPGQLAVGADVGGDEHTQLLYRPSFQAPWAVWTNDRSHIYAFGHWSQDGSRASYASNERTGRWFDIYVRDTETGNVRCVLQDDSTNVAGPFSPDGRWLITRRVHSNFDHELWIVDLWGLEAPRLVSPPSAHASFELPCWLPGGDAILLLSNHERDTASVAQMDVRGGSATYLLDPSEEVDEFALSADGAHLAYSLNLDGAGSLRVRELASGKEVTLEGLPTGALYQYWQAGLAWNPDATCLAISWSASRVNPNIWLYRVGETSAQQATFAPAEGADRHLLSEPEHVTYPTFDGRQIPALFYAARNTAAVPAPCVVVVHGGPESQSRPTFQAITQYLVSAGFAVLAPNVRGSSGYGKAYLALDDVRLRMDSVSDLSHAARWLGRSGRADPALLAVYGGSYGGFMVLAALTTQPELWAAGVDLVGIANFVTFLEQTGPWRRHLREREYGSLEHDREFLQAISPINHVENVKAPLMVVHGANDPRVPIGEAEQMIARLRALGRTVEFIKLDDEGHQISKLKNKLVVYPSIARFLKAHLLGTTGETAPAQPNRSSNGHGQPT